MRIFFDENLPEDVAEALNLLCKSRYPDIEIISTKKAFGCGISDEDLIPLIANEKGILVSFDKGFTRKAVNYTQCTEQKVSIISVQLPKGLNCYWEIVKTLIKYWEKIMQEINSLTPPYCLKVTPRSLTRLN